MSPVWLRRHVWTWLVNEGDWARRLGHYTMGFSLPGPIGWRVWAKAYGTHNAPLFSARVVVLPWLGKENIWDLPDMGISGPLMLVCSNVHITRGFPIFGITFNAALWGSHEAWGLYKGLAGWRIPLCIWLVLIHRG